MKVWIAIVVGLAGCYGGGGQIESDARLAIDARGDRGIVRVKVTGFVEKAGLRVYFQESDSSLSLATRTDANGEATGRLARDGFVTLIAGFDPTLTMWTYAGVQPGDELEFHEPDVDNVETPADSISVFASDAGAPPFTLRSSCGGQQVIFDPLPLAMVVSMCSPRMDFLLELGQVYRYAKDVDPTTRRVDFPGPFVPYGTSTVRVARVPASIGTVEQSLLGQGFPLVSTTGTAQVLGGELRATLGLPLPPAATLLTQIDLAADLREQHVVDWRPAVADIDLAFDEIVVAPSTESPRYDASTTSIVWSEGAGTPGDLVRATLHWLDGMHSRTRSWVIIGPRGSEPVLRVPRLPAVDLIPTVDGPQTLESFVVGEQREWLRQHMHGRWLAVGRAWPTNGPSGRVVWRSL